MLKYRINTAKFEKTKVELQVENVSFVDLTNLIDEENESIEYDGFNKERIMVICECEDIDKVKNGGFIKTENILSLDYTNEKIPDIKEFNFVQDYQISGVNEGNKSFSFYIDKYYVLNQDKIEKIVYNETLGVDENDNIFLYFNDYHYFDTIDEEIVIYFKTFNERGEIIPIPINFKFYAPNILVTSCDEFETEEAKNLFKLIFGFETSDENIDEKSGEGDLSGIEIYRENFLFGNKTFYYFSFERAMANITVPIVNTFETNLTQMELLNEYFVDYEKKKAINGITDLEKDVYYPCIPNVTQTQFTDVYTMKINLHFREHRGDDWLVENEAMWNCTEPDNYGKTHIVDGNLTKDNMSDLLTFLDFTNQDVHYQKNKLKKSFLRLMYFDSTNPANQNMIGYSTIFFDTGEMFAKYIKYNERKNYIAVGASKKEFGVYNPSDNKTGIRVDRESFDDETRLSSQFVVKSKTTSKASSEGFYIYIWKDNSTPLPQDLYMKVEFNHAGYGRTIPFMMPYWDSKKWNGKIGIKTFEEILKDWNDVKDDDLDGHGRISWVNNTDGHYGIRQYTKFSYIHLKYKYDKETDKHIYYLDPDTYGDINYPKGDDNNKYIEINLYEAKVE